MSTLSTKCLVAKIFCQSNTYYVASRDGIILDSIAYKNTVTSWGDASLIGNFGENYQIGSMDIRMVNGEFVSGGGWEFDITDVWNNKLCEVKMCDVGMDSTFANCKPYYKGLIKNFMCNAGELSFSIDAYDNSDDILLPALVCEDQSALTEEQSVFEITDSEQEIGDYDITLTACTIFQAGELVLLKNNSGDFEYNRIRTIAGNIYTMYSPLAHVYEAANGQAALCKKAFKSAPQDSVGKTIPIQCGNLNDVQNGVFAKLLYISEYIGEQALIADYIALAYIHSIGMWENGSKRYFTGRAHSVIGGITQGEYEVGSVRNSILFRVDSATTLNSDITSILSEFTEIDVTDRSKIQWVDESTETKWSTFPDLLSINIIQIGSELMMVIEKPSGSGQGNIWVERGYNNSTISQHAAGDKIYQCAKFSARNMLSFIERFLPVSVSNQYTKISSHNLSGGFKEFFYDENSKWNNLIDNDEDDLNSIRFRALCVKVRSWK
jgi:hypothetical protein